MVTPQNLGMKMRTYHRYLGFFLAGIMAVYAVSGIILIFRKTDFLKQEKIVTMQIETNLNEEAIGKQLKINNLKVEKQEGDLIFFQNGQYNTQTGEAQYTVKSLPFVIDKMTKMHKATTADPLFFLNIFFGLSLLFFVLSAFWMYAPGTSIFKKGLYFTIGGIVLALVIIFL